MDLAIVFISAIGGGAMVGAAPAAPPKFAIQVDYQKRSCSKQPGRREPAKAAPVVAGKLFLDRSGNGAPVVVELDEDGPSPAKVSIKGRGPIEATLALQTDRVEVTRSGAAERIELDPVKISRKGKVRFVVPDSSVRDESGHTNILIDLNRAARIAALASPRELERVRAVPAQPKTEYNRSSQVISVEYEEEWEPWTLAHEYGHFLSHKLKALGEMGGGDHELTRSYPERPSIGWNEGFADAFAALVTTGSKGVVNRGCYTNTVDLKGHPATPALASDRDKRYAQYNETRIGAVVFQLIQRLGGPERGLTRFLQALTNYQRAGHSIWLTRDLRDLAAQEFEHSAADHAAIDKIFSGQGISWYRHFDVAVDVGALLTSDAVSAVPELSVYLTGPGGFDCRNRTGKDIWPLLSTTGHLDDGGQVVGLKQADGGLPFSANDDCYLISGNGTPVLGEPGILVGWATLAFPYLSGLAHWGGDFELKARYTCITVPGAPPPAVPKCPATVVVDVTVTGRNDDPASPRNYNGLKLGLGVEKTLVQFNANGECKAIAASGDTDCGF